VTAQLSGEAVAGRIRESLPDAVEESRGIDVWIRPEAILDVCRFLQKDQALSLDYLVSLTAVDYIDHFELVYHLVSIDHNHAAVLKARVYGREAPELPSVTSLWLGAELQEREAWDLMGVAFTGHPNLRRILTWEGFPGHALQKSHLGG
jgi:NADH-quinone oxidoreductase subunit C